MENKMENKMDNVIQNLIESQKIISEQYHILQENINMVDEYLQQQLKTFLDKHKAKLTTTAFQEDTTIFLNITYIKRKSKNITLSIDYHYKHITVHNKNSCQIQEFKNENIIELITNIGEMLYNQAK